MKRLLQILAPLLLALCLSPTRARAWEAATTHAGLSEQSAFASALHGRLISHFGVDRGLFGMLTVPPQDAPALFKILRRLNPTHGYVPDASGRMSALEWLVLGSVVADVPAQHAANHFLDATSGSGLTSSTQKGFAGRIRDSLSLIGQDPVLRPGGMSALAWLHAPQNPLGYAGFASQFRDAVRAATPGERNRHLAGSLITAGAILHLLQDMGVPSHVRDDLRSHQQPVGTSMSDQGSRLERIAALAFGRLGIPAATAVAQQLTRDRYWSNDSGTGLANQIGSRYFSYATLPESFEVSRRDTDSSFRVKLDHHLRRPLPNSKSDEVGSHKVGLQFDLIAARSPKGATWRSDDGSDTKSGDGTCLARYQLRDGKVHWSMDDSCILEQLEAILPQVAGYGASLIDRLYPGGLTFAHRQGLLTIALAPGNFAAGTLHIYADSADGTRREYFSAAVSSSSASIQLPSPPAASVRITALFDGKSPQAEDKLASASEPWPAL